MPESIRKLYPYYKDHRSFLLWGLFCLIFANALSLAYPYLLDLIVNRVIVAHEYGELPWLLAAMLGAAVAKGAFNFGQGYLAQKFGSNTAFGLRNAIYHKLNWLPFSYYDETHTGDLMSRLTLDLDAFRMFLAFGINNLVGLGLIVVFGIAYMYSMNAILATVILILMPFLAVIAIRFDTKLRPIYRTIRENLSTLNSGVQENVMGVRTVKSFAQENREIGKFNGNNGLYFTSNMEAAVLWKKFFPYIELVGNVGVVLVLGVGGYLVMTHATSLGNLVAFLSIVWFMIWPMSQLGYFLNNMTQASAAAKRLDEVLSAPQAIANTSQSEAPAARGRVSFCNVSAGFGGRAVLTNIDLDVEAGQTVALLGLTGSGKSSLVQLIPRFYDPLSGQVLLDGVDVREWSLDRLRREVAVVFQEPFLFSTTIFANIAYGKPDATVAEVERAAALADAAEFIERLPEGYSTLVGERGLGLSGGQKQRLALARAILMNPSVLILDDATSAVDMETEFRIQRALDEHLRGCTTFVIAHRISTLKRADFIVVLADGRIVARGSHDELLSQPGLYRDIFRKQFADAAQGDEFARSLWASSGGDRGWGA
ncbi:MAG: ABC transporter ATP-binding protein [Alicyclobacillaceae bacterium]|uniref:ABC transporter ATP-binding protein n=1 Tax=Alicyclobacillus sp. SP_1 TaxID=2942475 RepID=UPI002157BC0F|nr:ABC transporter ATP-binding protein [Alicyclobacillus sp. SP_1]MCY0887632.1 ABC transporter ATP-binding protein [Alicyclobacillaceae bacterium]MCY0897275.1 ABC transporter ATP-binding protein [Alicyclobacillaceae bacterium]